MRIHALLGCLACLCVASPLLGQPFAFLGTAQLGDGGCVILTPDEEYCRGLAWSQRPLDLTQPFALGFDIFLGERDEGADGIAFVMQADPRGLEAYGTWGECLSYGTWSRAYEGGTYVMNSLAVEFDTYPNPRQNDPAVDHVAYLEDGSSYHATYYAPTPDYNLEDGRLHAFAVRWDPTTQELTVTLDGVVVHQRRKDLVARVFGGRTEVLWGFTASTGNKHNLQYFCLRTMAER